MKFRNLSLRERDDGHEWASLPREKRTEGAPVLYGPSIAICLFGPSTRLLARAWRLSYMIRFLSSFRELD